MQSRNIKMSRRATLIFPLFFLACTVISPIRAENRVEKVCKVTDPTGTPLNVRDSPNGRIINALRKDREVYIQKTAYDNQDRAWILVGGYYEGSYRTWGWVFKEFVSCYLL
jgi:hypothetical protein